MSQHLRRIGPLQLASNGVSATGYLGDNANTQGISGRIVAVQHVADGTNPYDDAFQLDVTGENSGLNLLHISLASHLSFTKYPAAAAAKAADGSASTLTEPPPALFNERIKIVLGLAGAGKTGQWFAFVE